MTRHALRFAVLAIISLGCESGSIDLPTVTFAPITDVVVYGGTQGIQVEVGDTVRIDAEGFHNGNGIGAQPPQSVTFATTDSTIVGLEPTHWTLSFMPTIRARGRRDGLVNIIATINGVTAQDSLRVIPVVGSVVLSPNPATVKVGDTITIHVQVTAQAGGPITTVHPFIQIDSIGYVVYSGVNQFRAQKPGIVALHAQVGRVVGRGTLTVTP